MIIYMYKEDANNENIYSKIIAVTNRHLSERPYLEQIERICQRNPKAVLVREKDMPEAEYTRLLMAAANICRRYNIMCIAHTYIRSAEICKIKTIHLPLPLLKEYGKISGSSEWAGTSVHSIQEVRQAEVLGAAYLFAGHIFPTDCKPGLKPRGKIFLQEVCTGTELPVYAIGGMTASKGCLEEMQFLKAAGICVMSECMRW